MGFLQRVYAEAKRRQATIILAEAEDQRILEAAAIIEKKGLAKLILLGDERKLRAMMARRKINLKARILCFETYEKGEKLAKEMVFLRMKHGLVLREARHLLKTNTKYFAAMLVKSGVADGYVAGNLCTTHDTLLPALELIGAKSSFASSYFFMLLDGKPLLFADCAFNIDPDVKELAEIGVQTAKSAQRFGIKPRVAFLSFSTHGSARHADVDHVREATRLAKARLPGIPVDGDLQFDAAWVPDVAKRKCPSSVLKGKANIFIFPNLNSGNIAYKIAQRMAGEEAIGPIVQGLKKPVNDLSRGCLVQDVVDVVAITADMVGR